MRIEPHICFIAWFINSSCAGLYTAKCGDKEPKELLLGFHPDKIRPRHVSPDS